MTAVTVAIRPRAIVAMTAVGAGVVVAAFALHATRTVIAELALAAAIACLVRPAVLSLARRTPLGVALAAVFISLVVCVGGLLGAEARAISVGATDLQHAIPDRIARLQRDLPPTSRVRRFLVEDDVVARVRHHIQGIPSRFILGTESPAQGASRLGQLLLVASLAAFAVTQLPKLLDAVVARLPAGSRTTADAAVRAAYRSGGAYIRRTLALAGACAAAGGLLAGACGVPGAAVLGLWLGMWAIVPKMGIVVGGLPLIALAAGQGRIELAAAALGLAVVVAVGEWTRRRLIERRTVTVGALLSLIAVMTGIELGRWPGALVALLIVAVVLAAADTVSRPTEATAVATAPAYPTAATAPLAGNGASNPGPVTVDIDRRSLLLAGVVGLALFIAVALIRSVPESLTRLVVGVLVALALNPLVGVVQRRLHFNRKGAVALVVGGFLAAVAAFAVYAVPKAVEQTRQLPTEVPKLVRQLDRAPVVGKAARSAHLDERFRSFLDDLPHVLATQDKAIQGAARSAGESMLAVSWMLLVLAGALLDGPDIARRVKAALPPPRRPRAEQVGNLVYQAVGRSAAGSAFTALLQGTVVLVIGLAFGVPLSPILAANAALAAFVPQVGGALAALPLILFGLTQGLGTGVAVGLLFLVWMLFNNHVLHAVIVGKAVHISALSSLVAVLVGGALGGFVGAMVATPLVAVVHVLMSQTPSRDATAPLAAPARSAQQEALR